MLRALLYLKLASFRNLVVFRVRRLRQPKYLLGTLVAGFYLYYFFLRRISIGNGRIDNSVLTGVTSTMLAGISVFLATLGLLRLAYSFISPPEKPGLHFSEAEIAFLFPAPVSRKALIHFRLLSAQVATLFAGLVFSLILARVSMRGGSRWMQAAGFWVVLSTYSLFLTGVNLALSRLKDRGRRYLLWRVAGVAAIALYMAAVVASAVSYADHDPSGLVPFGPGMDRMIPALLHSSPLRWLVLPLRVISGPYFADTWGRFALALVPALAVLALCYAWVSGTEASFEEGSIAIAEKRTAMRAAAMRGEVRLGSSKPKPLPGPFRLSPTGPPEVAFLWKNILSMRSTLLTRRAIVLTLVATVWMSFSLGPLLSTRGTGHGGDYSPVVALFCAIAAGYTLVIGPQIARQDMRSDLPNTDLLKTYPIEGWRLALGEILAPAALLSCILWFLIIVFSFAFDSKGQIGWLTPGVRLTAALSMGAAAPVLCVVQLIVPNLIMVLFPGWYQATRSRVGGMDLTGQRLIMGVCQLLFSLFVAAPAAAAASLIIVSSFWLIGAGPAIALSALVVLPVLSGEVAVGLWCIGERFGKMDVASEVR